MSRTYPMENKDEEPLLWVVDVWQSDDYRFQDVFFFKTQEDAAAFANWTLETDQDMKWPKNGIYRIKQSQIMSYKDNVELYLSRYGDAEDDE